jgi:hypothetical protein
MKLYFYAGVLMYCLSVSIHAKAPNPLCAGVTGSNFTSGNGTAANPFLVCNQSQFAQIATDATRLSQSFILGSDLNYNNSVFPMIGASGNPFRGTFDGNGYTLSSISISGGFNSYIGMFRQMENATVKNLLIDGIHMFDVGPFTGGLAGSVKSSIISNVRIKNINMVGPDYSGGLIGQAENSTISYSSTQGVMAQNFGTDAGGGFIGFAIDCQIFNSVSHVNIIQTSSTAFGVSAVGGFIGLGVRGNVANCYADGNIDYSAVTETDPEYAPRQVGGLLGAGSSIVVNNAFYTGIIMVENATFIGGAAGSFSGAPFTNVFWDKKVSGQTQSPLGVGKNTCIMQQKLFWVTLGFDQSLWALSNGDYPKLAFEN